MRYHFPAVSLANEYGLVAISPNINQEMMECAYRQGIFPWPQAIPFIIETSEGTIDPSQIIPWFSPDPRAVFDLDSLKLNRSWKRAILSQNWTAKINEEALFKQILQECACEVRRKETWLNQDLMSCYSEMFQQKKAYCIGIFLESTLVGGIFGIQLGNYFSGESMFNSRTGASKMALGLMMALLKSNKLNWLDSQSLSPATKLLGALEIERTVFMQKLDMALQKNKQEKWKLNIDTWKKKHGSLLQDSKGLQSFIIDKLS